LKIGSLKSEKIIIESL